MFKLFFTLTVSLLFFLPVTSENTPDSNEAFDRVFKYESSINLSQEKKIIGNIRALSIDEKEYLWILDSKSSCLNSYNRKGELITSIGEKGQGPGEFIRPLDFCIGKKSIYVVDPHGRKLHVFNKKGVFLNFFKINDGRSVQQLKNGNLLVTSPWLKHDSSSCVQIYSPKGDLLEEFFPISKVALEHKLLVDGIHCCTDKSENIFCVQAMDYVVYKFDSRGKPLARFSKKSSYYIPPPNESFQKTYLISKLTKWIKSWTHIVGLYLSGERLFLIMEYGRSSFDYIIDIYDVNGKFLEGGLATNERLLYIDNKYQFYFLGNSMNGATITIKRYTLRSIN